MRSDCRKHGPGSIGEEVNRFINGYRNGSDMTKSHGKPETIVVAHILWVDSVSLRGWHEAAKDGPEPIVSCGILAHEDDAGVTISTSLGATGNYADQMTIPKGAIVRWTQFHVARENWTRGPSDP